MYVQLKFAFIFAYLSLESPTSISIIIDEYLKHT